MRNIRMGFRHTPFAYQLPGNLQGLTSKFLRSQSVQLLLPAIRAPMNDTGLKTRLEHREVRLVAPGLRKTCLHNEIVLDDRIPSVVVGNAQNAFDVIEALKAAAQIAGREIHERVDVLAGLDGFATV